MFIKWRQPTWKGIGLGFILIVILLFLFQLPSLLKFNELSPNSEEGIEAEGLRMQRYDWLEDGCPQPPIAAKYMDLAGGDTNYTYTGNLMGTNALWDGCVFHGLFATKRKGATRTLVITTSGDILAVEDSGQIRLLERMDFEGRLIEPQHR